MSLPKRLRFLVASVVFVALSTAGAALANSGPPVTSFDLDNGMKIVVIEDHRAPVVTHMIWYKVGAADEGLGKSGIAHFLEHLLFKATDKVASGEFSKVVALNGGSDNAFTSSDYTAYHQRISKDRLSLLMKYEADRMTGLKITKADVETERQVVLEERASRTGSRPGALLNEQKNAALYQNHPYGRPIIGWEHEIRALSYDDIFAFYRKHYRPSNAILVVAGDVEPNEVLKLAMDTYGVVKNPMDAAGNINNVPKKRVRPTEPPSYAPRRVEMIDKRAGASRISRTYVVPSYATSANGEGENLEILSQVLGGGSTARLYRKLVVEQKLAIDSGAYYRGGQLDFGEFVIYAVLAPGGNLEALEAALDDVIDQTLKSQIALDELGRAKTSLIADMIYEQDSQSRLARTYGASLTTGLDIETVKRWPDKLRAATGDDIVATARQWLKLNNSVTATLRPGPSSQQPNAGGRS